jgi:hypothetical protein
MSLPRRLDFFVAGDDRELVWQKVGASVWRDLAAKGFANGTSLGCVGFSRDIHTDSLVVVLPKAFSTGSARRRLEDASYQREQIYRLIRVFKKIRRSSKLRISSTDTNEVFFRSRSTTDPVLDSFDAALTLRREYRAYGIYLRKTQRNARNKLHLPVDWARTVRQGAALISDKDVLYTDFVNRYRRKNISHPLCMLHLACLKEIFGFTGEKSGLEEVEALEPHVFRAIKRRPRAYLRDIRRSVFDERGRFLLSAIAAYLGESRLLTTDEKQAENLLSYSKDFEDIWEELLRDLLSPQMTDRQLPAGEWRSYPIGVAAKGKVPELDILFSEAGTDVIVDAKDYRVLNGSKMLGTGSDYYKQVLYRLLLPVAEDAGVLNILAFPSVGQSSLFSIRGCHSWRQIPRSRVYEVTVDYDLATKLWLREVTVNVSEELSSLLMSLRSFSTEMEKEAKAS